MNANYVIRYVELIGDRPNIELAFRASILTQNPRMDKVSIHATLKSQLEKLLLAANVYEKVEGKTVVNLSQAQAFYSYVDTVLLTKTHSWKPSQRRPLLFTSPPELIPQKMAADVDDIRNLLTELVRGAKQSLLILSPYTTARGLTEILKPILTHESPVNVTVYLANPLHDAKRQIAALTTMIRPEVMAKIKFYYRADISSDDDSILHAKILVADGQRGYLGSANFTSKGLQKHFELGVELSDKQSALAKDLLEHLVEKAVFLAI